jgi:uncharacterized membrane protein
VNFEILNDPIAEIVIWLAVLAVVVAVGFYVIGKIRSDSVQKEPGPSEMISKFRDLHAKGELSDAEFRTIKTTLAARLQEELKDNGETGYEE